MRNEMEKVYLEEKATKDSIIHDLKTRIEVLNKQLSDSKKENEELKKKFDESPYHNEDEKDVEIQNLINDNTILNEECIRLKNQCDYLIMKENKLRYFYDTLNTAVYPMQDMIDNKMKNIPTTRFYEYLESQHLGPQQYEKQGNFHSTQNVSDGMHGNELHPHYDSSGHHNKTYSEPEPIQKSEISFDSQDSYEPLFIRTVKPKPKPDIVPKLCLEGLPEYETSSDEEEQDHNMQYQNGYQYIDNFYKKINDNCNTGSMKDSNFDLSSQGEQMKPNAKKSLMYSKSNHRSSSIDLKTSESF